MGINDIEATVIIEPKDFAADHFTQDFREREGRRRYLESPLLGNHRRRRESARTWWPRDDKRQAVNELQESSALGPIHRLRAVQLWKNHLASLVLFPQVKHERVTLNDATLGLPVEDGGKEPPDR